MTCRIKIEGRIFKKSILNLQLLYIYLLEFKDYQIVQRQKIQFIWFKGH